MPTAGLVAKRQFFFAKANRPQNLYCQTIGERHIAKLVAAWMENPPAVAVTSCYHVAM